MNKLLSIQAGAFAKRLKTLSANDVDAQYVSEITTLIQTGPWSVDQGIDLCVALCSVLTSTPTPAKQPSRAGQEIRHFQHYLSAPEALLVGDASKPIVAKIDTVIHRMAKLELTLPSEQSLKHILTVIIVTCGDVVMEPATIRSWYVQFKDGVHSRFKNVKEAGPIGHIVKWPEHPSKLDEEVRNIAYADAPPVSLAVSDYAMTKVSNAVAMRKNAAILRSSTTTDALTLLPAPAAGPQCNTQNFPEFLMPLMQTYFQFMNTRPAGGCNIQFMQGQQHQSQSGLPSNSQTDRVPLPGPDGWQPAFGTPERDMTPKDMSTKDSPENGSPEDQANKFLSSMKGGTGHDAVDDNEDEEDDDDASVKSKLAAKLKPKTNAIAKSEPQAKGTSKPKFAASIIKSKAWKPTYGIERSRSQVQCRTGHTGPGQNKAFKFSDYKTGLKGAEAAAIKWVAAAKKQGPHK